MVNLLSPNLSRALLLASEELLFGGFAGARGINHLHAQGLIVIDCGSGRLQLLLRV